MLFRIAVNILALTSMKIFENQRKSKKINENQGNKIDLNGYYKTDDNKTKNIMRPSKTLNLIIDNL